MLNDLFSSFDDHNRVLFDFSFFVWAGVFLSVCCFFICFWSFWITLYSFYSAFVGVVDGLVSRSFSSFIGGSVGFFSSIFFVLIMTNLFGLVPYVFSVTSHLAVNLSISLPLWVGIVLMSLSYDSVGYVSHFQPLGSPTPLNPFLCLIELVSNLVRPLTLAVRLTANLSTGHVILSLLGVGFCSSSFFYSVLFLSFGLFYVIFEMAVCLVQSYIFTLLPVLYVDDHPHSF